MGLIAVHINSTLNLGALHALYSEDGKWYQVLTQFPGVLFDPNGFLMFNSKYEYQNNLDLQRGKRLNIPKGISKLDGYQEFTSNQSTKAHKLIKKYGRKTSKSYKKYYLIGSLYGNRSIYPDLIKKNVVSIGFCWDRYMGDLYQKPQNTIRNVLRGEGFSSTEYSAVKRFLQLKPGDIVAVKSRGWPRGKIPCLEIVAYAMVVERDGKTYWHDPADLGHCINVEFIETGLYVDKKLGYGQTIYEISDQERIDHIFESYQGANESAIRKRIRKKRKRTGTTKKKKGQEKRKGSKPYVADLKHNEIQEAFYNHLKLEFPKEKVIMEEDFVDIKRENKKEIILYEVKPYAWAEDCIREGFGQLLSYASQIKTDKTIKLIIVGPYDATREETKFIQFVDNNMHLNFEYMSFKI